MAKLRNYIEAFYSIPIEYRIEATLFTLKFAIGGLLLSVGVSFSIQDAFHVLGWSDEAVYLAIVINTLGVTNIIVRYSTVKWRDTYYRVHGEYFSQIYPS